MRRGRLLKAVVVAAVLLGGASAGCTAVVPGTATAAPPQMADPPDVASQNPTAQNPTGQNPTGQNPTGQNPTGPVPAGPRSALIVDPIRDECLLNASEFGLLVGGPVRPPEEVTVDRGDGSTGSSCVVTAGDDPIAMINVYRVRSGTPADYVRAGGPSGRRVLAGVGQAAAVIDTAAGPTLQLASPAYLVTILVSGRRPADDAWRAAAAAALSRLPS